jgi:hypothetical protein
MDKTYTVRWETHKGEVKKVELTDRIKLVSLVSRLRMQGLALRVLVCKSGHTTG